MLEMLSHSFIQRAILAGVIVAVVCPAIGLFLVLRRAAQYGDTLAHISLAGMAAGLLLRTYPVLTGLAFAVVASLGMDRLRQTYQRYGELSLAIMASASLALAVVLLSMANAPGGEILEYLFGAIITVTKQDLYLIGGLGLGLILTLLAMYKELLSVTFDEEGARISGLPVRLIHSVFMALTAMMAAIAMQTVGVLLVSGLMVVPVAVALQLAQSFRAALIWAVLVGLLSVVAGLIISYQLDLAPGGTIILSGIAILLMVLGFKRLKGME